MIRTITSSYLTNFSTSSMRYVDENDDDTDIIYDSHESYDKYNAYINIDTWNNFITTLEYTNILNKDTFIFPDGVKITNTSPAYSDKYRTEYLIPDKFQFNSSLTLLEFGLVQLHKNMKASFMTMYNTYPISIPDNLYNASLVKIIDNIKDGDMEFYYESYLKKLSNIFNYKFDRAWNNMILIRKK